MLPKVEESTVGVGSPLKPEAAWNSSHGGLASTGAGTGAGNVISGVTPRLMRPPLRSPSGFAIKEGGGVIGRGNETEHATSIRVKVSLRSGINNGGVPRLPRVTCDLPVLAAGGQRSKSRVDRDSAA